MRLSLLSIIALGSLVIAVPHVIPPHAKQTVPTTAIKNLNRKAVPPPIAHQQKNAPPIKKPNGKAIHTTKKAAAQVKNPPVHPAKSSPTIKKAVPLEALSLFDILDAEFEEDQQKPSPFQCEYMADLKNKNNLEFRIWGHVTTKAYVLNCEESREELENELDALEANDIKFMCVHPDFVMAGFANSQMYPWDTKAKETQLGEKVHQIGDSITRNHPAAREKLFDRSKVCRKVESVDKFTKPRPL